MYCILGCLAGCLVSRKVMTVTCVVMRAHAPRESAQWRRLLDSTWKKSRSERADSEAYVEVYRISIKEATLGIFRTSTACVCV